MQCQTSSLQTFMVQVEQFLPDFVTDRDILKAGIVNNATHLHRLRARGEMPPFIKVGGLIRYRKPDVMTWLRSQCHYPDVQKEVSNG